MVRDLDRETMITHFLLVDLGATMREGRPGETRLDLAVDLAHAYAKGALEAGDRVGLLTFDGRIVGETKPNDGPVHRLRLLEPLMEAMNLVDEDLTELTDSELVAAVARYLLLQEGVDARVSRTPTIDDPAWAHLATAPSGELYDLRVLHRALSGSLREPSRALPRASSPELARLRLYCRLRGIELPFRRTPSAGQRARGLAAALERAATGRGTQRILVLSDLEGLDDGIEHVQRAVRLARRRGHHLLCATPSTAPMAMPRPLPSTFGAVAELFTAPERDPAVEILGWDERRRERAARRRLAALGVRVVSVGAGDPSALLHARALPQSRRA
jgi:uncharacterized protein (DUF58 family)